MGWLPSVHLEDRPTVVAKTRNRAVSFEDFSALERDQLFGVLVLVTGARHDRGPCTGGTEVRPLPRPCRRVRTRTRDPRRSNPHWSPEGSLIWYTDGVIGQAPFDGSLVIADAEGLVRSDFACCASGPWNARQDRPNRAGRRDRVDPAT
jgi:hypothetical protein